MPCVIIEVMEAIAIGDKNLWLIKRKKEVKYNHEQYFLY